MKLGFIGLGIMDTPMAINLVHAGHQLRVTTIGPIVGELLSLGAVSVETMRQVIGVSDVIFTMMPDTPQVEDTLFGENGYIKVSLRGKTIVDMSPISPIGNKRSVRQVNELGGDYLDAPVSGSKIGVREETLSIMIGGDEVVFGRVKPLFELLGKNITFAGGSDDGQTCRVVNQIIVALNTEAVSEVLLFTSKTGAGLVRVYQALMGSFASLRILEIYGEHMIKRIFNPGFKTALHWKNLSLAL